MQLNDKETVEFVVKQLRNQEFKRYQSPPILKGEFAIVWTGLAVSNHSVMYWKVVLMGADSNMSANDGVKKSASLFNSALIVKKCTIPKN